MKVATLTVAIFRSMRGFNNSCICPMCLQTLKDAVILNCSHNLCYECAYEIIEMNSLQEREVMYI